MRISTFISCAALAGVLVAVAAPAPAHAQVGGIIKKVLKKKASQTATEKAAKAVTAGDSAATAGPMFTENTLEITPELLDRFEKGLAAEADVQQEIDRLVGKVLPQDDYDQCRQAVIASPEGQKVYMETVDRLPAEPTQEQLMKASQEMSRRLDQLTEPTCGLAPQKAAEVRRQHADRLAAAAPKASGLTELQLSILKERIVPLCAAIETLSEGTGDARIPTESEDIYWVYTRGEVDATRPRCGKLAALSTGT